MGFNLDNGRLDVSVHPFTGGAHPTDVRMTTRFKGHDMMEGITGAIHETGHALYEQGDNRMDWCMPVIMVAWLLNMCNHNLKLSPRCRSQSGIRWAASK